MSQVARFAFGLLASVLITLSLAGSAFAFRTIWTKQMGTTGTDTALAVAADSSGNAYVAGYSSGALDGATNAGSADLFVVKYNSSGVKQWSQLLGTTSWDAAQAVAVDSTGNVYVTGCTAGGLAGNTNAGLNDVFLVKYNSSGTRQWARQFGSASSDYATGVSLDASGNVYVAGYTYGGLDGATNAGQRDIFVAKYSPASVRLWTRQMGSSADDAATAISVDTTGNSYVVGLTYGGLDGNVNAGDVDMFIVKYDTSGVKKWTVQRGTTASDEADGVAVDSTGAAYVVGATSSNLDGNTYTGGTGYDLFIMKFDTSGNRLWTRETGTTSWDQPYGVSLDSSGNAYMAGWTNGVFPGETTLGGDPVDIMVGKYDKDGNLKWARQKGTTGVDRAYGVVVDPLGDVYVAGSTGGNLDGNASAGGDQDLFLMKVDVTPPTSAVTAPGAPVSGVSYTINGTSADGAGTGVTKVEVSINGGAWQAASGTTAWTYLWTLPANGSYTVRSRATDRGGNVETPGAGVSITVGLGATPTLTSISPASGNAPVGVTQTYTAIYSDADGATDIKNAYLLVNTSVTSVGGVYIWYVRAANKLYLLDDAGSSWGTGSVLGAGGTTLTNSRCTVACATSASSASGANLTLTLKITFTTAFLGAKNLYMCAVDNATLNTGWLAKGTVFVDAFPTATSFTSSTGYIQASFELPCTLVYSDANGATDIKEAYLLFNTSVASAGAVYLYYNRSAGRLYLRDDANASWGTGSVLGAGGTTLTNNLCTVACGTGSVAASGVNLTIHVTITFSANIFGVKNVYMYVKDNEGLNSGWVTKGTENIM